jgi:hypothetical protein
MIPAVNYNGNKWNTSESNTGDTVSVNPLTYSYRRTAVQGMSYSESAKYAASFWCDSVDFTNGVSCSFLTDMNKSMYQLVVMALF